MLEPLPTIDSVRLPPEGSGTIRALSRIGYELPEAIADLIDNSIDAAAKHIEVTFFRNDSQITAITVADDGHGMDMAALMTGMRFAGRTEHASSSLGTYGMGLKSASFSQAQTMTVVSRRQANVVAGRWAVEAIGDGWSLELLDPCRAEAAFDKLCLRGRAPSSGTLVMWERLERLVVGRHVNALDKFLNTALPRLEAHLGLTFHRFLEAGALSISLVVRHERRALALPRPVKPRKPFNYAESGREGWPRTFECELPGVGALLLNAHIWPAGAIADDFLLGSKKGVEFQGFYFYRNQRLIQAGGWNGVIKSDNEPDLALARVAIELPPGGIEVNVQKSALQVTAAQALSLLTATDGKSSFGGYLDAARAAYREFKRSESRKGNHTVIPGAGIPMPVRRAAQEHIAAAKTVEEVGFLWEDLAEDRVFELDLSGMNIFLNKRYRREILNGASASKADAALVKILLFQLYKDDFGRQRSSRKQREHLDLTNSLLLEIIQTRLRRKND